MPIYDLISESTGRTYRVNAPRDLTDDEVARETERYDRQALLAEQSKPFLDVSDLASSVGSAIGGLRKTLPASLQRIRVGLNRPDTYPEGAKKSFAEERAFSDQVARENTYRLLTGNLGSVGESVREAGTSLGFSVASMGSAIPASIAGGAAGTAVGGPVGGMIGGTSAGMAASGAAAYRMAGSQFLDDAFNTYLQNNPGADEATKEAVYRELLPLAQNSALWEAGPEAIGNAATLGAGKIFLGIGRKGLEKIARSALAKTGAVVGAQATELATETATQLGQGLPQAKADAFNRGEDMATARSRYTNDGAGALQAFKDVAPQTLALGGLMLGAGGAVKGAQRLMQPSPTIEGDTLVPFEQPAAEVPAAEVPVEEAQEDFGAATFRQDFSEIISNPNPIVPLQQTVNKAAETSVAANADVLPATAAVIAAGGLTPAPVQEETPVGAPVVEQPASGVLLPETTPVETMDQVRARLRQRISAEERATMEQNLAQMEDEGVLADVFAEERQRAAQREDAARRQQDLENERQRLEDEGILGDVFAEERQRATAREQQRQQPPVVKETVAPIQPVPAVEETVAPVAPPVKKSKTNAKPLLSRSERRALEEKEKAASTPGIVPNVEIVIDEPGAAEVGLGMEETTQTIERDVTKPEQMTPEEVKAEVIKRNNAQFKPGEPAYITGDEQMYQGLWESPHKTAIFEAREDQKPVNAAAVDTYGITLPTGYVREGDLYVYRPSGTVEAKPAPQPKPGQRDVTKPEQMAFTDNSPPAWMSKDAIDEALASLKPSGIIALPKSAYQDIPENITPYERQQYVRQIESWASRANDLRRGIRVEGFSPQQSGKPPVGSVEKARDDRGTKADAGVTRGKTITFPDVSSVPAFKRFQALFGTDIQSAVKAGFITEEKSFASNTAGAKLKITGYSLRDGREFTSATEAMKAYLAKAPDVSAKQVEISGITLPEGYVQDGELYVYRPSGTVEAKPTPPVKARPMNMAGQVRPEKKSRSLPTFTPPPKEPFKPSSERFTQFYVDDGFPEATAAKNGAKLMDVIETGEWSDILRPDNVKSRAIWETWTGKKLPKGLAASKGAVAEFTAEYRAKTFTTPAAELSDKELDAEILRIAEQGMKPTASQTLKDRALELSKEFQARRETAKTQQEDSSIKKRRAAIARKALAFTGGRNRPVEGGQVEAKGEGQEVTKPPPADPVFKEREVEVYHVGQKDPAFELGREAWFTDSLDIAGVYLDTEHEMHLGRREDRPKPVLNKYRVRGVFFDNSEAAIEKVRATLTEEASTYLDRRGVTFVKIPGEPDRNVPTTDAKEAVDKVTDFLVRKVLVDRTEEGEAISVPGKEWLQKAGFTGVVTPVDYYPEFSNYVLFEPEGITKAAEPTPPAKPAAEVETPVAGVPADGRKNLLPTSVERLKGASPTTGGAGVLKLAKGPLPKKAYVEAERLLTDSLRAHLSEIDSNTNVGQYKAKTAFNAQKTLAQRINSAAQFKLRYDESVERGFPEKDLLEEAKKEAQIAKAMAAILAGEHQDFGFSPASSFSIKLDATSRVSDISKWLIEGTESFTKDFGSSNAVVTKEAKDKAVKSLRKKIGGQTNIGGMVDPALLKDAVIVGTFYIEGGVRSFAEFSAKMIEEVGAAIEPYLRTIYDSASMDLEYLAAVESGDMAKAQAMVDGAAKEAGINPDESKVSLSQYKWAYLKGLSHRETDTYWSFHTPSLTQAYNSGRAQRYKSWDGWKPEKIVSGWRHGNLPDGGVSRNHAENIAEPGLSLMALVGGERTPTLAAVSHRKVVYAYGWLLPETGSDNEPTIWPSGISNLDQGDIPKATHDPVVYNESGQVIPLSQRFNPETNDIRGYGEGNTVVTKETAEAAAARMRKKMGQTNVGIDPSLLKDAVIVGTYHLEAGARSFAEFSAKMIEEFGAGVQKYLRPAYDEIRKRTDIDTTGMDPEEGGETAPKTEEPKTPPPTPKAEAPKAEPKQEAPKPAAAAAPEPKTVPIANDPVDVQRVALGLPPIMRQTQEAYTFPQMWADAEAAMRADPNVGKTLVESLNKKPRTISALEDAILLRERVNRVNALDLAMVEFNKAPKGNNETQRDNMDTAITELTKLDDALNVAGTEQGRSLNARKMLARQDYTLAKMITTLRAANDGNLSEDDVAMVTRLQKQIAETQAKLAEVESGQAARLAEAEKVAYEAGRQEVLKDIQERAKADAERLAEMQKRKTEYQAAKKEAVAKPNKWEEIRAAARARNAELRSNLYSDVVLVKAASMAVNDVIIGATYIAEGVTKLADWVTSMRGEGYDLPDYQMEQLFNESKAFDAGEELPVAETPLKTKKAKAPAIDKVKAIAADEEALDSRTVYELVVEKMKARAEANPALKTVEMSDEDLSSIISEVTADIKPYFPDATERFVRDKFSGYGVILKPSQDELAKQTRQLSALGKLASAIEDAEKQRAPLKSGPQRDKATQAIRLQQKKLARELRMMGQEYEAEGDQLRSPLDAIKARINNQINDLDWEIRKGRIKSRPKTDYDPEAKALLELRDELKRIETFLNAPAGPTLAETVAEEMKSLDKRIAELQKKLDEGKFAPKPDTTLYTQELQAKRDELAALSKVYQKAKKQAIGDVRTQDEIDRAAVKDAKDAIDDLEKKIAAKDVSRPQRRTPTETEEYQKLVEEKKTLQKVLAKLRESIEGKRGLSDEQRIKAAEKALDASIDRMQKMVDTNNVDVVKRTPKTPDTPELKAKREARNNLRKRILELRKLKRDAGIDPIAKQISTDKKRIQTRMKKLKERLDKGDFSKPVKKTRATDEELLKLQIEEEKLKEQWAKTVFERQLASRGPGKRLLDATQQTLNTARAVLTSFDVSAVLRQAGFIVLGNPLRGLRNLGPMFKAFGDAEFAKGEKFRMQNRENYKNGLYQQAKLFLADTSQVNQMNAQEEAFMTRWLDKLPNGVKGSIIGAGLGFAAGGPVGAALGGALGLKLGSTIRGSQRAYTVFLNRLRMDSFDAMVANLKKGDVPTPQEIAASAKFINTATGRGDLGKFNQDGTLLNTVYFAPRLVWSRFLLLAGHPYFTASGRTKALVLREYAKFLAGAAVVYALGSLAQDDDDEPIETDPRSSDFLKIRFGDTRVDPLSGLIQATVLLSRLASGEKKTAKGKIVPIRGDKVPYGGDTSFDVLANFNRTKFSPIIGSAVNMLEGKNVVGESTDALQELKRMVIPMSFNEAKETLEAQGVPEATALIMLQLFGMGVQTYTPGKK